MNLDTVFGQFPMLKSDMLILKKIEENHLDGVYEIYSNDTVFEYCGIIPKHNRATVKSMIGHFEERLQEEVANQMGDFPQ